MDKVKIAKALSDPIRYQIMQMIMSGSKSGCCTAPCAEDPPPGVCNCVIMAELGLIQSRVSYHMKELTEAGLVIEEPQGKWKYYSINTRTIKDYVNQLKQDFDLE